MANKKLNEDTIRNELKDHSLHFQERDETPVMEDQEKDGPSTPVMVSAARLAPQMHPEPSNQRSTTEDPLQQRTARRNRTPETPLSPFPAFAPSTNEPESVEVNKNAPLGRGPQQELRQGGTNFNSTDVRSSESPYARPPVRVKRTITRYAFEFYQDQVETLKGFSLAEQVRGEKGSMSQMVREALDAYISKRKRTED